MADNTGKKKKKKKRGNIILFIVEILILVILVGLIYVYAQINNGFRTMAGDSGNLDNILINENVATNESLSGYTATNESLSGYTNVALVGIDTRYNNINEGNSDTMLVASINNDTGAVRIVSLYRDTYLNIDPENDNWKFNKCNSAYAFGGVEQFLSMLNGNLDLNITEYVIVDFSAVATLVDDLDGIDILLTEEEIIHLNNYCVETAEVTGMDYEPLQYERGQEVTEYHLNGVQAVAYARIRYTVGDDLKRTQRQRLVIEKIVDKAKVKGITSISKIINDVFPLIKTSFSSAQLTKMAAQMFNYNIEKTSGFPFETLPCQIGSLDAIVPVTLKDNVVELHYYLFDEENYEVSNEVASYSQEIEETSGFGQEYRESAIEYGTVKDNGGEADITR